MLSKTPTLAVICKRPKLHQGKQRLAQTLHAESVLKIAQDLLHCAIEDAQLWQGPTVIACAHPDDILWAQSLLPEAQVIPQVTNEQQQNLGQRLNHVDQRLRELGHESIIYIGTDAPMLNTVVLNEITTQLCTKDIVLSHADDGGVIAMANNKPWPNLTALPWSTELLSQALYEHCQANSLSVDYVSAGYDIDYVSDLKKLFLDLQTDKRPARQRLLNTLIDLPLFSGVTTNA